jgi:hypothetical protein
MVERQLPKLHTRVRFPSPAPVHFSLRNKAFLIARPPEFCCLRMFCTTPVQKTSQKAADYATGISRARAGKGSAGRPSPFSTFDTGYGGPVIMADASTTISGEDIYNLRRHRLGSILQRALVRIWSHVASGSGGNRPTQQFQFVQRKRRQGVIIVFGAADGLGRHGRRWSATPAWPTTSAAASITSLSTSIRTQTACSLRSCLRSSPAVEA